MTTKKEKIINFEVMGGWPIYKMNLRDILEELGATYNSETGEYTIKDSEVLDVFPRTLEDDGMGYGVNEKYITSFDLREDKDGHYCNVFVDPGIQLPELWLKYKAFPGMEIYIDGKECVVSSMSITDVGNPIFVIKRDDDKDLLLTGEQLLDAEEKEREYFKNRSVDLHG